MTVIISATLLALMQASPPVLWSNITAGMPRAEVERLYPAGSKVQYQKAAIEIADVQITERCFGEVNIRFGSDNNVREVMVAGNPSMGGRCSNEILTGLSAKYGQPANWDSNAGSILARQGKVAVWGRSDGVSMRFKKFEQGILGGGGMLKASWELTYSAANSAIAL